MFKRILVPTDVSEPSNRALKMALELAKQYQGEILLLHVIYTPQAYWGYTASYGFVVPPEELALSGKAALEAALTGINTGDVPVKTKYVSGYPAGAILDEIKKQHIDLVVMGSRGHGPIKGAVLGSVSQRVLAHAECPVMVVK